MMLAAEFGTGEVFWSLLWFFLFFVFIMLIFSIFGDIIRSDDLSGWGKALWSIFIIFLPYLGAFVYLLVRGGQMSQRQVNDAKAQQSAIDTYIRDTAAGSDAATQLAKLADLHTAGKIDDTEYAAAKAKVIA
jgi:Phospholipase_D-nuclease N-terminal